ncbi:hypothetical protein NDU88_000581 [Pleurodeles waltl]|uniref:C-type lectin domain-containing protein n=1 Tax=Pleurodeles waltl TaxID=8319 RepID=A0AAV7P446_PLEWA|nr:hypothetical protein NDU88_000581 [Pleurodeles waltl]
MRAGREFPHTALCARALNGTGAPKPGNKLHQGLPGCRKSRCVHVEGKVNVQLVPNLICVHCVQDYIVSELNNQVWIGLFITPAGRPWTWVNGSSLNEHVFNITGPADEDLCGAVNRGSVTSSRCINSFYWICQKEVERCSSRN